MAEDQFKEKTWSEEQEEARRIMAEQEAEMAEMKEQTAQHEAEEAQPSENLSAEALDRERGARFSQAIAMARMRAVDATEGGGSASSPELDKLDEQIAAASKEAEGSWKMAYLMLIVGAGTCDLLQLVGDVTLLLSLLSSAFGIVFSGARYLILRTDAQRIGNKSFAKDMITRTLVSGGISLIPIVNFLPEQTTAMLIEWQKRRQVMTEAFVRLDNLKTQRAELAKQLSQE